MLYIIERANNYPAQFIIMSNEPTTETAIETNPICPLVAHIVWEDYGVASLSETPENTYVVSWQVTGMEEPEDFYVNSLEEGLEKALNIIEDTPDQVLIQIDGSTAFAELPLEDGDTSEEILQLALECRKAPEDKPGLITKVLGFFKRKNPEQQEENAPAEEATVSGEAVLVAAGEAPSSEA